LLLAIITTALSSSERVWSFNDRRRSYIGGSVERLECSVSFYEGAFSFEKEVRFELRDDPAAMLQLPKFEGTAAMLRGPI
jgi:hypothetical protein